MKKKLTTGYCELVKNNQKLILSIMKRTLLVSMLFFSISASAFSQVISLNLGKVKLSQAFKEISKKTNVDFFYSDSELNVEKMIMVNYTNIEVEELVSKLVGSNYNVEKSDNGTILISPIEFQQKIMVAGVVKGVDGIGIPGVTIQIKGTNRGNSTNFDGKFEIEVEDGTVLIFRYLGHKTIEVTVDGNKELNIVLAEDIESIDEVIVTGIVSRNKSSFTGAVTSATGKELKSVSNVNVVQGIKTFDPAFAIIDDNDFGGNPNLLPKIEVRGKTSITTDGLSDEFGGNPNQPLFILDGFETTLRTIVDLDMNRVASITVLKDASSTALYGAKAANGVVVVETIRPLAGDLRVTYNVDFSVEIADLNDYELMNSTQKLEYERLSGYWTADSPYYYQEQFSLNKQYNATLAEIKRGVDTYWLDEPTQTGTNLRNSIYVSGGSETFTYAVGVDYRNIKGVMKGSGRKNWGTNIDLTYRKDKFNISNRLYINGYDAEESHYGSFSNYANANPYFRQTDADGNITNFLDIDNYFGNSIANPLYNASLNSFDNTNSFNLTNNFSTIYTVNQQVRLQGNLQLRTGNITNEIFVDPEHTSFNGTPFEEKGSYDNIVTKNFSYRFNVMATYAKVFKEKHRINANLRGEVEETNFDRLSIQVVGYPSGTNGNPAFAFGYKPNSQPSTAVNKSRRVNVLASINYDFNRTLFFDGTYRLDGSTVFGSNEKYSPFWSIGAGWNLHETFKINPETVSLLKLRASTGLTGNQGFGNLSSVSIYGFNSNSNIFGQATELETLANPNLEWQNTLQKSFGIDAVLFKNRLSATVNYYTKKTDPLVVRIDLPSSTGVYAYPQNAGFMDTEGFETYIRVSLIYRPEDQKIWSLGIRTSSTKSEYGGFQNLLKSLDDNAKANSSLYRYRDGNSPDDLWAVPSLGIDPSNGEEVFLTKEGLPTYNYDQDDEVVLGNGRPTMESIFSSNLRIKNFLFNVNLRYTYGGDRLNRALFNKVENISRGQRINNQDVRALTQRWIQPGDITPFKSISSFSNTPISSRFIQKENVLIGESINVSYEFKTQPWLKKLSLERLRLSAYMNDIFRVSSIETERGLNYPFTRAVSFSLNAYF